MGMRTWGLSSVCCATCGMHVFIGFVEKIFGHFSPAVSYRTLPFGLRDLHELLPIYSTSIPHKSFRPEIQGASWNLTKYPTVKTLTNNRDLSDLAELPPFLPPTLESTIEYRTSPFRQARMRPNLKATLVYIESIAIISLLWYQFYVILCYYQLHSVINRQSILTHWGWDKMDAI